MRKYFLLLFILLSACNQQEKPAIAFYYWKTIFKLSTSEKETLKQNEVKKLYIRYFDVDLEQKLNLPFPKNPIKFDEKPVGFAIIPVIYIKNNVFLGKNIDVADLATKTYDYINQINIKNQITIQEIQIDCDWTLTSKKNYLQFITDFKKISRKKLSATIRLHQIKYFKKTGVPNVDKGVLMYYNMGEIAPDSVNSIYDKKTANRYLASLKNYPLSLNIALPIYSWAIHIRDGKVIALKNKIDVNNIEKDTNFVRVNATFFKAKRNNYKGGTFYKANDFLKIEMISQNNLLEMATDLNENCNTRPQEIIFYDLDQFNTQHYEKEIFKTISNRF